VCTTDSKHSLPVAPNLLDQIFLANRPNQVWLADITYIPTGEGWLYLAVILDLFTRKAVGWAMHAPEDPGSRLSLRSTAGRGSQVRD
jgi:transposase InsO family protein